MASFKFDAKAFEKKALQAAADAVKKRIEKTCCPVHGQHPKVTAKFSGSNLSWDVSGCCDQLVAQVKAALK